MGRECCPVKYTSIQLSYNLHTLQAILATRERHSPAESATRILPSVSPLTVDPVSEVRQNALLVVTEFAKILREHCIQLDEKAAAEGGVQITSCMSKRF